MIKLICKARFARAILLNVSALLWWSFSVTLLPKWFKCHTRYMYYILYNSQCVSPYITRKINNPYRRKQLYNTFIILVYWFARVRYTPISECRPSRSVRVHGRQKCAKTRRLSPSRPNHAIIRVLKLDNRHGVPSQTDAYMVVMARAAMP